MSLLGAVVRKIDPKIAINYFRRNLMGSGSLGRKEISKIKGDLKNLSQEDRERLRTADLEDLTPAEVDLVMFGFVGFKDFGMPNKTIAQMKGNEFTTFKNKLNKIVDDVKGGKTESVEEFTFEKGIDGKPDGIKSKMVEKQKELPKGDPTQLTLFNEGGKASMLKPDYIDIDGDGNKTEPMKTAAKQRDGMAIGGISKVIGSAATKAISKMMGKGSKPKMSQKELEDQLRELEFEMNKLMDEEMTSPEGLTGSKLDYANEVEDLSNVLEKELRKNYPESKLLKNIELRREIDADNRAEDGPLLPFAKGGDIDGQMAILMMPKKPEEDMLPDDEMEDEYLDFILDEALDSEEEDYLMSQLQSNEQLSEIFDKVIDVAQEFAGSGPVEGPGSGVSDSIPARLSDGEFVFTAKAVEEIGADNLMAMMKDAEMKADDRQGLATGGEPEERVELPVEEQKEPQVRVVKETVDSNKGIMDEDEVSKGVKSKMMLDPDQRHVRS